MRKFPLYFLILFVVSAAGFFLLFPSDPVVFRQVQVNGKFSISIPDYLSKTDSINPSAVLQYQNAEEEVFILVFEEKDTARLSLKERFHIFSEKFTSRMESGSLLNYHPEKINGLEALLGDVRGQIKGTEVYYLLALVRSERQLYSIITGVSARQKSKYRDDLLQIIRGFKTAS